MRYNEETYDLLDELMMGSHELSDVKLPTTFHDPLNSLDLDYVMSQLETEFPTVQALQ